MRGYRGESNPLEGAVSGGFIIHEPMNGRSPRTAAHLIEDISYRTEPMFVTCICGWRAEAPTSSALEDQWDLHRGLDPAWVASRASVPASALASPEEVSAFLRSMRSY